MAGSDVLECVAEAKIGAGRQRVLAVGELNPYGADPRCALLHLPRQAAGNRLRLIMGLSDGDYLRHVARVNLCDGRWSGDSAEGKSRRLLFYTDYEVFVLLGAKVREIFDGPRAFGRMSWSPLSDGIDAPSERVAIPPKILVGLPHPSGRCRAWNDSSSITRAREVLASAAPWVPWGKKDEEDDHER